jgi:hypothetical protein
MTLSAVKEALPAVEEEEDAAASVVVVVDRQSSTREKAPVPSVRSSSYWLKIERSSDDPAGVTVSADVVWLCSGSAKFLKLITSFIPLQKQSHSRDFFVGNKKLRAERARCAASANVIAVLRRAAPFL